MSRLPTLKPKEIIAILKQGGFIEHHQKGSHLYLWNPKRQVMTSVSIHPGDTPRPVFKQIIKQAGFTEDEFRRLI